MNTNNIAEIQISYVSAISKQHRTKVTRSIEVYKVFQNTWNFDLIELQEEFKILLLNNANEVLGIHNLARGTSSGVNVDLKLLFSIALKTCATSVIIAHNHPSGNLIPSQSDKDLTLKIKKIGELLDIKLLDHLIVTKEGYCSLSDESII
ncbi:MAG: DNA repair protein [Lutibacter sp. BRH_c52]|nr:MAG: DNA repair protein [Lutibacter sp. BRH_c52]